MSLGDAEFDKKVADWLKWDRNEKSRAEIENLVEKKDVDGLKARMNGRLLFGTAGDRIVQIKIFGNNNMTVEFLITSSIENLAITLRKARACAMPSFC